MPPPTKMLPDEAALVARALIEPSAFGALYDHYFPREVNYVRYRIGDAAATDDITAQAFERILAGLKGYRADKAPFGAWLFAIVRNTVRDHLRGIKRRPALSLDDLPGAHSDDAPLPEEITARREWQGRVLEAVQSLGEREREIVALKYGAGFGNTEIAALMGLTPNHVNVLVSRTHDRLRHLLEPVKEMWRD
jgi:RNA polymerase sigma factor (sigma-70 family)